MSDSLPLMTEHRETTLVASAPPRKTANRSLFRNGTLIAIIGILLLSAGLRFAGQNWDANQHLHPDERFMTMVSNAIRWPASLGEYFDTARSPLSPYNNNFSFYVYGTFPLFFVKLLGLAFDRSEYDQIHLVGRAVSALFDVGTCSLVLFLGRRLYGVRVGLVAGLLYAIMAFPIQQSHFFTVDSFASFFAILSAVVATTVGTTNRYRDYAFLGVAIGLGLACKISMFVLIGLALLGAGLALYDTVHRDGAPLGAALERIALRLTLTGATAFLVFRVFQPIAFQGPGFLDLALNDQWLKNIAEAGAQQSGEVDLPPGHQWTDRPALWFPWSNMVIWGMGLPLGIVAWLGWGLATWELVRQKRREHVIPAVFIGAVFLYQGTQWVKSMRYFLHLYPFLAITASYLILRLWGASSPLRRLTRPMVLGVIALTVLYAIGFTAIYLRPQSRIAASRWIYENVPRGAVIANEHWDDPLPVRLDGMDPFGGIYRGIMLNNYDDDNPEKLDKLVASLMQSDYVVLSSNRLYDSIPRLPMRYPMTTRYYELLLSEQLGFKRAAEFTSYPSILGIPLPDQSAEEAWSVYDHPKVTIFQKAADFNGLRLRSQLSQGIDWDSIVRLRPDQATKTKSMLLLSSDDRSAYQAAGTWKTLFSPSGITNQVPALFWWGMIQVIGVASVPLTFLGCRSLIDGGYGLSKALGLLMVSWLAWVTASFHFAQFGPLLALGACVGLLILSAVALLIYGGAVRELIRSRWRLLLIEECVFSVAFLGFLWVRATNPDLWNPALGGEKPMDFAYLNAVIRSAYFPPYDPWFAGGYINYYYFGFVLVATLTHLTGIVPAVAYNLAIPTFFAATAIGAFVVALNLAHRMPDRRGRFGLSSEPVERTAIVAGLFGAVAVAVIGNLGELRLIAGGIHDLGRSSIPSNLPGISATLRFFDGLREVLFNGKILQFRTEWWYWNATRIIAHPSNEAGPINEFPYFTFLYGDLHAHLMALPITLLSLGLMLALIRDEPRASSPRQALPLATLGLLALAIGALWPMNTWDFPTFALLAGATLFWRTMSRFRRIELGSLGRTLAAWLAMLLLGYILFLPFHRAYAAGYSSIELWRGSRTLLDAYLTMHGIVLFVIVTALMARVSSPFNRAPLAREIRLLLRQGYRAPRLFRLSKRIVHRSELQRAGMGMVGAGVVVLLALVGIIGAAGLERIIRPVVGFETWLSVIGPSTLAFFVVALCAALLFEPRADARHRFLLTIIAFGAILTVAVEIVVLKGDIGRMNTVFKFYLQVWTLWSIAAAACVPGLLGQYRDRASVRQSFPQLPSYGVAEWWRPTFAALAIAGLLYPLFATYARAQDRFENSRQLTLDGLAYMDNAVYNDKNQPIPLIWDRQAIDWLLLNVEGSPVIVEAVTPLYRWGSRISVNTGLPTVIGWDWHQKQQRAALPGDLIDRRVTDVNQIFGSASPERTAELLRRYSVRLLYVGQLERLYYPGVEAKMRGYEGTLWNRVYDNQEVSIYEVRPD